MLTNKEYIDSGMLELYVLGAASPQEAEEVETKAASDPAVRQEIEAIRESLENYAKANSVEPHGVVRPFLLAIIDYTERLKNGEAVKSPPLLHEHSMVSDYNEWLQLPDMVFPGTDDLFAKIIGYTPEAVTAIVWLKNFAPYEVHEDEYERFLIVEGTCTIIVGDEENQLGPGDYFAIPLYKNHMVKVTSSIPCKVILQRVAA